MSGELSDVIGVSVQDVNKTIGNEYGIVTKVNNNGTINFNSIIDGEESNDDLSAPVLSPLDLKKGDKVIISYIDNNSNSPVVLGMINPKLASDTNGRGIVTVEKVETDEFVDIYRITYDQAPIYSYFQVPSVNKILGLIALLIEKGIITQEEVNNL